MTAMDRGKSRPRTKSIGREVSVYAAFYSDGQLKTSKVEFGQQFEANWTNPDGSYGGSINTTEDKVNTAINKLRKIAKPSQSKPLKTD